MTSPSSDGRMSTWRLALRSLVYYRRQAMAGAAGIAFSAAVITGSLIAGGSVQNTIRYRAFARLGDITHAVTAPHPLPANLAQRLQDQPDISDAVPVLILSGTALNPETDEAVPNVQVLGVPPSFLKLYRKLPSRPPTGRTVWISEALAQDLGIRSGDMLLNLSKAEPAPGRSLFARRQLSEKLRTFRVEVAAVVPQEGPGGFSLRVETGAKRTVITDRDWLAAQTGHEHLAHAILVRASPQGDNSLVENLTAVLTPEDFGLTQATVPPHDIVLRSRTLTVSTQVLAGLKGVGRELGAEVAEGSLMLLTRVARSGGGPSSHYILAASTPSVSVGPDEIALSEWLAEDLRARPGDAMTVEWMEAAEDGSYPVAGTTLRVSRVIATATAVAEKWLVPDFEGITDVRRISDWDPPFPVDMRLITPRDEAFWERYRAAPRAFVSRELMQRMWHGQSDWVTAVRFSLPSSPSPAAASSALVHGMRSNQVLRQAGPQLRDLRAEAEVASQGSSDFRGLMLGMSGFLVLSALGLSGALMHLAARDRASQMGIIVATGCRPGQAAAPLAIEASLASLVGAVIGAPAGVVLATVLVRALNTWWSGAVARESILLTVSLTDLLLGALSAALLGVVLAVRTAWSMSKSDPVLLLAGWRAMQMDQTRRQAAEARQQKGLSSRRWLAGISAWLVVSVLTLAALAISGTSAAAFLTGGALLLVAGLGLLHASLGFLLCSVGQLLDLRRIALRNAALHRGHSTLIAGMAAAATFVVVTVAANVRNVGGIDVRDAKSGAGGFDLIVRSTVPLPVNLATPGGRAKLGFSEEDEELLGNARIVPFLVSDGVDTGCLNLARPDEPRVVGVPDDFIKENRFTVDTSYPLVENAWQVLTSRRSPRWIPAFGDGESVRWILRSGLGQSIRRQTEIGPMDLRFEGLLRGSIFAGELLVSEKHFRELFPSVAGPTLFLIRVEHEEDVPAVAQTLQRVLGEAGIEVRTTQQVLAELMAVQNTYLSAFLVLGGLGIILGLGGMGALMLRSAYARRSEFAILAAMGFPRAVLVRMVRQESMLLLVYGAALGTATAFLASWPRLVSGEAAINWPVTVLVLVGAVLAGGVSCAVAGRAAVPDDTVAWLRRE